jgi:hypothetical protein
MSIARLLAGQRVYVLRDESGVPVGVWGNVVRECYGKALAWVRLDEPHARCPFPDSDARATWILTLPEHCSSLAEQFGTCVQGGGR